MTRGRSVWCHSSTTLQILFEKALARDRFVSIGVLPNVSSVKLNRDVKPGMSVYSRTTRLTSNHIKSPKKLPFPQRKRKRRQKCCGYCEHCTTIGLRLARLGNTVFSKRKTVQGKPIQKFLGSIGQVRFTQSTLRQASIRENKRTIAWKNTSQTSSSAKSQRCEIWGQLSRRDCKTTAMRPKQSMESCQKHTSSKRTTKLHSSRRQRNGVSSVTSKKRKFVVDSRARLHVVSKRNLNSAELETMRISRSYDGDDGQRRGAKHEKKPRYMSKNMDLFVKVMLLEETPAVLSLGKLCKDHGYTYHWTRDQKPHLTKKGQENWLQYLKLCAIRSPWFIYWFLYNAHTYFFIILITGFCIWRYQTPNIQYPKEVEVRVRSYGETAA